MRIVPLNNNFDYNNNFNYKINKQQNFNGLIKDKSILPILANMSDADILEFKKIEKRLSKTKFWDMKISSIGNHFKEFLFEFINKQNKHGVITNGIFPYNKQDNTIKFYTIVYGPENISKNITGTLQFKSKDRADEVYKDYLQNLEFLRSRSFNLTPIESLKSKEIELNMLEEAEEQAKSLDKLKVLNTKLSTKHFIGNDLK